jgi:hypothetical protein
MAFVQRSTFCFDLSGVQYKTYGEISDMRRQWNTFERIETLNYSILNKLGTVVPPPTSQYDASVFVRPVDNAEKIDYLQGQLAHIARYPDISDFLYPYADRPIPYLSSVTSTIFETIYSTYMSSIFDPITSTLAGPSLLTPIMSSYTSTVIITYYSSITSVIATLPVIPITGPPTQIIPVSIPFSDSMENKKARNLFIAVSSFTGKFPKSPYKFSSSDEYVLYKKYRDTVGHG